MLLFQTMQKSKNILSLLFFFISIFIYCNHILGINLEKHNYGFNVYKKGNCMGCHKWHGDGGPGYGGAALSLRETGLDREQLILIIECGRPGTNMPYFDKKAYGHHINIVDKVFLFLSTRKKKIPSTFMKEQLKGLEKDHGNVDLLSHRLSNVRTWSYVANKKNWVENSDYWVQLT